MEYMNIYKGLWGEIVWLRSPGHVGQLILNDIINYLLKLRKIYKNWGYGT